MNHLKSNNGQALVEMALSIILLMTILIAIFEFGRAMYVKNTLNNSARSGARQAIVSHGITEGTTNLDPSQDYNGTGNDPVLKAVKLSLFNGIKVSEVQVSIDNVGKTAAPARGDTVEIKVTWTNFQTFTRLIDITNTLTGTASMRYE